MLASVAQKEGDNMSEDKMDNQGLKSAGLKVTSPRVKILNILENALQRHISAEDIYRQLLTTGDDVGLATIYRVLGQFASAGLVTKHHFAGHAVFELSTGEHHDHLVCVECGKVEEFFDPVIEARQLEIAKELGFTMTEHCLYLYGICQHCTQAK